MSDIIKSNFISFSEQKRTIKTIDKSNPKILQSSVQSVNHINQQSDESPRLSLDDLNLDEDLHSKASSRDSVSYEENLDSDFDEHDQHIYSPEEKKQNEIEHLKMEAQTRGYQEGFESGSAEGYNQGYEEGKIAAEEEINQALIKYQNEQENEKAIFKKQLESQLIDEYNGYQRSLEPKMLTIIESLVRKLIGVQEVSQGTIVHLIKCGIDELELHGDLVIKVSSADLDYVIGRRDELTEELSEKIKVEILKDQQLQKNECIIETEMGTIDCSLGTQLDGLMKELRLIKESLLVSENIDKSEKTDK